MTWLPPVEELRRSAPDFEPPPQPPVPPTIVSFTVDEDLCVEGSDIVLRWETADADTVTIDGLGVVALVGSARVFADASRAFALHATNEYGEAWQSTDDVHVLRMPAVEGSRVDLPRVRVAPGLVTSSPSASPGRLVDVEPRALWPLLHGRFHSRTARARLTV